VTRAAEGDDEFLATVDISFARFDVWNEIESWSEGHFLERLDPGAFADTISERGDNVKALYDHGHDPGIGNKVLGPVLALRESDGGPEGTIGLLDTSYNRDLLPGLEAGLYGASYRFSVDDETMERSPEPSDYNPDGLPERTIHSVNLFEFGPVTFPADEGTSVGTRSLTDTYAFAWREEATDLDMYADEDSVMSDTEDEKGSFVGLTPMQARSRLLRLQYRSKP